LMQLLVVISGPTASGKTALGIRLAQHFGGEILSADSRQIYREMTIGTAKPTPEELALVPHHFIGSRSVREGDYSVGDYEKDALCLLEKIYSKNKIAFIVGGTGLFIKAVCEGLDEFPEVPPHIKAELDALFQAEGTAALQAELKASDPIYYEQVDTANPHRLLRALSVIRASGQPFSSFRKGVKSERPFKVLHLSLAPEREKLYARINDRVLKMKEMGLEMEARNLLPFRHLNALNTVGYQEMFAYIDGEIDLETAIGIIQQNSRRYAKRQVTWFKKQPGVCFLPEPDAALAIELVMEQIQHL
jgi:tRNA dimethylallyltransferase